MSKTSTACHNPIRSFAATLIAVSLVSTATAASQLPDESSPGAAAAADPASA
jgi:hypothetical protein